MEECVFCKIVQGKLPSTKLYEDKAVLSFLDIFPITKGHALVIPKNHYRTIVDVPEKELGKVLETAKKIGAAQMKALGAKGFNILQSNEKEAGQVVFHAHFHVIPRKEGDGLGFRWPSKEAGKEELYKTQKIIKENLI